jgi:hypothetical protein
MLGSVRGPGAHSATIGPTATIWAAYKRFPRYNVQQGKPAVKFSFYQSVTTHLKSVIQKRLGHVDSPIELNNNPRKHYVSLL